MGFDRRQALLSLNMQNIGRDQLEDWAKRTNYSISEAEKWLAPLL